MASNKDEEDDTESWLDDLGSLKNTLLDKGLKHPMELLWLNQDEIEFRQINSILLQIDLY